MEPGSTMNREPTRKLYRPTHNRMIAGVAAGIADYIRVDPTIVRIAWVVGGLLALPVSAPIALILYFVLAMIIPNEPE